MLQRYGKFSASVSQICSCIQKIETEEMAKYGLRGSCAQYLAVMYGNEEGLTVSQLSDLCLKDKAAVSRAISQLEEKDLVKRILQGSNLYRAPIVLTKQGKDVAEYVAKKAISAVELAGKGLEDDERQIFYSALDLIAANLTQISKEGLPE